MKKLIFVISMFILTLNSCVKETLLKVETATSKSLNAAQQEALNDGLMIVKNLSANKVLDFYEVVPEKFKSRINAKLNATSVSLYHDKAKNGFYFIYQFENEKDFINSLGGCSKKWNYENLNSRECKGQGTECEVNTYPDGSWDITTCIFI